MMIRTQTSAIVSPQPSKRSASRLLSWGVALSSAWFGTGLYLDGWAHTHELPDTFFTPWHGVIYSGFLMAALFLVITFVRARRRNLPMPTGYGLSLIGVGLFLIGGVADLIWHTSLGIRVADSFVDGSYCAFRHRWLVCQLPGCALRFTESSGS